MLRSLPVSVLLSWLSVFSLPSDGAKIGDPAPALTVDEWVQGTPVTGFQSGLVYVVEFWGTWCSPCIKNIPKLNRLQTQHASDGLVVIGVASHEFKGREALTSFMKKKDYTITYRVAYDEDLTMEKDWDTGGKEGVVFRMPLCFVVDRKGIVVFAGHPENEGFEQALDAALAAK